MLYTINNTFVDDFFNDVLTTRPRTNYSSFDAEVEHIWPAAGFYLAAKWRRIVTYVMPISRQKRCQSSALKKGWRK